MFWKLKNKLGPVPVLIEVIAVIYFSLLKLIKKIYIVCHITEKPEGYLLDVIL